MCQVDSKKMVGSLLGCVYGQPVHMSSVCRSEVVEYLAIHLRPEVDSPPDTMTGGLVLVATLAPGCLLPCANCPSCKGSLRPS